MANVFLSYAKKDGEIARRLAARLKDEGWSVFWDRDLLGGDNWPQRLEEEAQTACCVVALWSEAAGRSSYVLDEATIGQTRGVLVPAILEPGKLPLGFRAIQAVELTDWDGASDTSGLANLIEAIAVKCGHPKSISMVPLDLVIVVGRPKMWPDLGPTVNLTCKFINPLKTETTLRWLEASVAGPEGRSWCFVWKLMFDTLGATEHKWRIEPKAALDIPPGEFKTGIQLRAPTLNNEIAWPGGSYTFQLLGWNDRNHDHEPPNLRTEFKVLVSDYDAWQVNSLLTATDEMWEKWRASDNARGVRVQITNVRTNLSPLRVSSGAR